MGYNKGRYLVTAYYPFSTYKHYFGSRLSANKYKKRSSKNFLCWKITIKKVK